MKKQLFPVLAVFCAGCAVAAEAVIALPSPALTETVLLKKALENRQTNRTFSTRTIPAQELANLLWAANGSNRENGKRTVPAALGKYAISLYVALPDGLYFFDREKNQLERKAEGDFRDASDGRKMGSGAGAVIIFVADVSQARSDFRKTGYIGVEAGAMVQNIYLYCASAGLNTVVCGSFNHTRLRNALALPETQEVFLTQVVGYPAK